MGESLNHPRQPFCKLANPANYVACSWDLSREDSARIHWVAFHEQNFKTLLDQGVQAAVSRGASSSSAQTRAQNCEREFVEQLHAYGRWPLSFGLVTILTLDIWRDDFLRRHGFHDPLIDLKNRENEKMLRLLPGLCRQLDSLSPREQLRDVILGVFAGNIFDMGSKATAELFLGASPDFYCVRNSLAPRPWLIDDFDSLADRFLNHPPHRKAVYFIDNAGSDFLLGALPMMRWLALRGTKVVLATNELPTLNDMSIGDVRAWWPRILDAEPSLKTLPITPISTGTGEPLIDLSAVSPELNTASTDADLLILEGMGRGVESNLDVDFTCDTVNLAMIKDPSIARRHSGKLFDIICRFRKAQE